MNHDRKKLIEGVLARHGFDGLIAWAPEEIVMLTGALPHWGLSVAAVPADASPILYLPHLEPVPQLSGDWQIRTFQWGDRDCWAKLVKELSTIASSWSFAWKGSQSRSSLPGNFAEIPPWPPEWPGCLPGKRCDAVLDELLQIKTPADAESLRKTHRIALKALETFHAAALPGRTEAQIAAEIESVVHSQTGLDGIDTSRAWACVQSGPNTAKSGCFNRSSGRRLQDKDPVLLEIAVCVDGYWADLTHSILCGNGTDPLCPIIREAACAALKTIQPGASGHEVDLAAREVIRAHGYAEAFTHATGHPVGFRYHDSGPMLAPGSTQPLAQGMVLTVEPGIYLKDRGARIETNVLVTENGAEILGGPR